MELTEENGVLLFAIYSRTIEVKISEIICISLSEFKKNIDITIETGFKSIPLTLEEVESKLQNFDFFKTKESVLINKAKIDEIDAERKKVILNNGMEFNVTRRDIIRIKYGDGKKPWWWWVKTLLSQVM